MFVTRKTLNWLLGERDNDIRALQERYWSLWRRHSNLLAHLGLTEVEVPAKIELRTKGGPEQTQEK